MRAKNVMIVDDDLEFRANVRASLAGICRVTEVASEQEFRARFVPYAYDLVILDMRLESGREGLALLKEIQDDDDLQPVIMVSAYGDTEAVLDAIESGALMFLHKQEASPELIARMVEAVFQQGRMRRRVAALETRMRSETLSLPVGISGALHHVTDSAIRAADDGARPVVVIGEPGTGRRMVARLIHGSSRRRSEGPFVSSNGALTVADGGLEALLGSAGPNGAARRRGLAEEAHGGVLYMANVEQVPPELAVPFFKGINARALDLGPGRPPVALDVQLIAGTEPKGAQQVLRRMREAGLSRRTLEINLPALRDRVEDIPLLAQFFLQTQRRAGHTTAETLSRTVFTIMESYSWPGNVEELRTTVEYASIQARIAGAPELAVEHLPANLTRTRETAAGGEHPWDYRFNLARAEVRLASRAMTERGVASKTELARALGYNDRFGLMRRIRKNLTCYPNIAREFPQVARMFGTKEPT